jgi:Glyoxalase/Bleomycin resistance protein/Dioxygenase superfamily
MFGVSGGCGIKGPVFPAPGYETTRTLVMSGQRAGRRVAVDRWRRSPMERLHQARARRHHRRRLAVPAPIDAPGCSGSGLPGVLLVCQTASVSSDNPPDLHMLNVIVRDMAASLDFYQRLRVPVPGPGDRADAHLQLKMPGGFSLELELDTAESARLWHATWRADPASTRVGLGFMLSSRQAVDDRYAELTAAGYRGRQPPFDAFWGAVRDRGRSRWQRSRPDEPGRGIPPDMAAASIPRPLTPTQARL